MAETTVENQVCNACGADVRKGALFCYHCGGKVAAEIAVVKNDKVEIADNLGFRENISAQNGNRFKQIEVEAKQEIKEVFIEAPLAKPLEKSSAEKEPELKTAAAMRGKTKTIQPKKVEVVWEEHENAPNIWFILVALFLTIVAAVILFLALRMR